MKTVIGVLCVILAVQCVTAQCPSLKTYTTELKPACDINDIYIKWPNYANQSTYYTCFGVGNPVLTPCPSGDYFTYVYQQCTQCNEYIPAPVCENLKTQNTPNCVAIGTDGSGGNNSTTPTTTTGYPTPNYPSTTSSTTTTATTKAPTTTTTASTNTTATTASTTTVITPPTVAPTSSTTTSANTTYPGPPSPVTSAPNVPTPPTPAPTPPVIDITPPSA
ncbi:peritrophin-55-like [Bactrocera tryoni]|uniref:peritrophin-55-like n=1 Tax=Bactrocera tryoni TaxID=59916 RepID=UPI001A96470D|nr:peritrophin-55-like [Bactrocera tryoni]